MAAAIEVKSLKLAEVAVTDRPDWREPTPKQGHIVQLFFNVNLIKAHRGLGMLAHEYGIDLERLVPGQYIGFLNRRRTAIKLFTSGNIYAYLRLHEGQVTAEIVNQIPRVFQSPSGINFAPVFVEALESGIPPSAAELDHAEWAKDHPRKGRTPMRLPTGRERS